jgi:hypothetical protein
MGTALPCRPLQTRDTSVCIGGIRDPVGLRTVSPRLVRLVDAVPRQPWVDRSSSCCTRSEPSDLFRLGSDSGARHRGLQSHSIAAAYGLCTCAGDHGRWKRRTKTRTKDTDNFVTVGGYPVADPPD